MKPYNSIDIIPIFNFWKLQTTGELKYLYKNWFELDKIEITTEISNAQKKIFEGIEHIEFYIPKAYIKCQLLMNDYFVEKNNPKRNNVEKIKTKFNFVFAKYLDILNISNYQFQIGKLKSDNIRELHKFYKDDKKEKNEEYFLSQLIDFYFLTLEYKAREKWDLYEEISFLSNYLKREIDEHKVTAQKYFSIKKNAIKNIEIQNKNATRTKI